MRRSTSTTGHTDRCPDAQEQLHADHRPARLGWSQQQRRACEMKEIVTRDELIKMLDSMEVSKIEVEECYGGSLEVFVYAKDDDWEGEINETTD
jgi:hypothetical protein